MDVVPAAPRPRGGPLHLVWIVTKATSADVLLRGQLRHLREHGFEVSVIAPPGPELDRVARREGAAVHPVPIPTGGDDHHHREGVLERRMRSVHRCYREYYSPESRRLVADLYADDCERFGYVF